MASGIDSPVSADLLQRLCAYLAGCDSLDDFHDWFHAEIAPEIDHQPPDVHQMAYQVWRLLSEYDAGGWTEPELRSHLRALEQPDVLPVSASAAGTRVTSAADGKR
jgi:hypothetical protein